MKLPKDGSLTKTGRTSRSMRVSTRNDPKISARFLMPTANVPAKSATFVYPWIQFVPRRYTLAENFPCGNTSAVGTNHRPVSPKKVVVAGRVSDEDVDDAEGCAGAEDCVLAVCAPAPAAHSTHAAARPM